MKFNLTLGACLIAASASAQQLHKAAQPYHNSASAAPAIVTSRVINPRSFAKATAATAFYTDTFNAASLSTGGWTTSGNHGPWRFTKQATNGGYSIGTIFSTTAAGGWMLFDSDSAGAHNTSGAGPVTGTLTSPAISCIGHSLVGVRFQQYTARFNDTFIVQVSNNGGTTWTDYPVYQDMGLLNNDYSDNPAVTVINIAATAANQVNVKVRFYYSCSDADGGYNWLVDDFQLVDLDPVDLGVYHAGLLTPLNGDGLAILGTIPKNFVDTVLPFSFAGNFGGTAQTGANLNCTIFNNGTSVYNHSIQFPSMPVNAYDTSAFFSAYPFTSVPTGNYIATFSLNQASDGTAGNNTDTVLFGISDSSLCVFTGYLESSKTLAGYSFEGTSTLHNAATGYSGYSGAFFDVGAGKQDTVTSVSVCLGSTTTVGAQIIAEIYKFDNSSWQYKGTTYPKTLTAADISTSSSLTFTTLPINAGKPGNRLLTIVNGGTWAVVVRAQSPLSSQTITIVDAMPAISDEVLGFPQGLLDTADGAASFDANPASPFLSNTSYIPAVVVNFGSARSLGVHDIAGLSIGHAYPNPANTAVTVTIAATAAARVNVSLVNMAGQLVQTQDLGMVAVGAKKTATFSTATLPAGTYLCTVEANGERSTEHVVVTH